MSSRPSFPFRVTVQSDCRHVVHVTLEAHRPKWFADHEVRFEASRSVGALEAQSRTTRRWWGGTSASSTVVLAAGGKAVLHCDTPSSLRWSCRTQSREPRGVVTQYSMAQTKRGQERAEYFVRLRSSAVVPESSTGWRGEAAHATLELACAQATLRRLCGGAHLFHETAPRPATPELTPWEHTDAAVDGVDVGVWSL